MVSTEVKRYADDVDEAEVPSAKWGWSKINYRTWHITGFFAVFFLLVMMRGNHVGKVEDIFLVVFAVLTLVVVVRDIIGRNRGWFR